MSSTATIEGTVTRVNEQETFRSGFTHRSFVVQTSNKYPQDIEIEAIKDRIADIEALQVGDRVIATVDIRGRYWEKGDKYFTTLALYQINIDRQGSQPAQSTGPATSQPETPAETFDDDMPF